MILAIHCDLGISPWISEKKLLLWPFFWHGKNLGPFLTWKEFGPKISSQHKISPSKVVMFFKPPHNSKHLRLFLAAIFFSTNNKRINQPTNKWDLRWIPKDLQTPKPSNHSILKRTLTGEAERFREAILGCCRPLSWKWDQKPTELTSGYDGLGESWWTPRWSRGGKGEFFFK